MLSLFRCAVLALVLGTWLGTSSAGAASPISILHLNGLYIAAQPLPTNDLGFIPDPGAPNWWALAGDELTTVLITPIRVPAGCGQPPLQVSEYNPEGHFIKVVPPAGTAGPLRDFYRFEARYPGRYFMQVSVVDRACGGIEYRMSPNTRGCVPDQHCVATAHVYHASADECAALKANVTGAGRRLQNSKKARHRNAALVRRLTGELASARQSFANGSCTAHA
ncbi:MAG: hypothetical protein QOD61_2579 [Solirubrobacteraceae bacterium]|nr:hypothetical protein [Solirubrobacteraceae bacterium]